MKNLSLAILFLAAVSVSLLAASPPATAPAQDWRAAFESAYALAPGQNLKYIPPGAVPLRKQYFTQIEHNNTPMPFIQWRWTAQPAPVLERERMSAHGPNGAPLAEVLNTCATLDIHHAAVDPRITLNCDGDWIIRDGATPDAILAGLQSILHDHFKTDIGIDKKQVPTDCLIITGSYNFQRLPESTNGNLEIFADVLDHPKMGQAVAGGGNTDPAYLWSYLGEQLGAPLIDESKDIPSKISWSISYSIAGANNNPVKRSQILHNITTQTTLTFKPEKRPLIHYTLSPK